MVLESGHMDGVAAYLEAAEEEEDEDDNFQPVKAQDLHAMLTKIFRKYIELQETGFKRDLYYNGHCYKEVEFVLFTPFLKLTLMRLRNYAANILLQGPGMLNDFAGTVSVQ